MSGSLDLQSVKIQRLILQNPDGSFPAAGGILAVVDRQGTVGTVSDITAATVSVDSVNITGAILQDNITATEVWATSGRATSVIVDGLLTAGDISATNVDTVYLSTADLSSGPVTVVTLDAGTLTAPYLLVTDLSASTIEASSVAVSQNTTASTGIFTNLGATVVQVTDTIRTGRVTAYDVSASRAAFLDISSQSGYIAKATVTADVSANSLTVGVATVASDVSVNNLNVTGTFNFNQLDLDTVIVNGLLKSTTKINTAQVTAPNATIGDLSAEVYDISALNVSTLYNTKYLVANTARVADLSSQTLQTTSLTTAGSSIFNSLTSNTFFATAATVTDVSATNLYAQTVNATVDVSLNKGILTYGAPSTLYVDGISTKTTEAYVQQPYYRSYVYNGLATTTDISNTLLDLTTNFNNFMNIFSDRGLAVNPFVPGYIFNSPVSIQFTIRGVTQTPVTFAMGSYTLTQLLATLNAVSPVIRFTALPPKVIAKPGWQVRIDVSGGGTNTYIGDITGVPTSSLQMLRYLGFVINDGANPFQTYMFSGSEAVSTTLYNISGSYISTGRIGISSNFPVVMPTPTFTYASSPSSLTITLTNLYTANAKYVVIYLPNQYFLYNALSSVITLSGLGFGITYPVSIMYLDNYNRGSTSTTTMTTQPLVVSNTTTFNRIALSWTNPGSGYIVRISAAGQFITPTLQDVSASSYTYSYLLRNSPYVFNLYCLDVVHNISGSATIVNITTNNLLAPSSITNSNPQRSGFQIYNTVIDLSWDPAPPQGAVATLTYNVRGGILQTYNIPVGGLGYTIRDLSNNGDISATIVYTDNSRNTVTLNNYIVPYTTTFGFSGGPYDASANAYTNSVLNSTFTGFGYSCYRTPLYGFDPNRFSYFSNCSFNNISFPKGIRETTGNTVRLIANIYYIPAYDYCKQWIGGFGAPSSNYNPLYTSPFTWPLASLSSNYGSISSNQFIFPAGNTNWRTDVSLNFSRTIPFTPNTVILFQIVSGSGNIEFSTYSCFATPNGNLTNSGVTGLRYDNTNILNTFKPDGYIGITPISDQTRGVICNFNLV